MNLRNLSSPELFRRHEALQSQLALATNQKDIDQLTIRINKIVKESYRRAQLVIAETNKEKTDRPEPVVIKVKLGNLSAKPKGLN